MTHDTDSRPKFRRRAQARPDEVLDAALNLFVEQGYAATTVQQIAARAGLSKGAVYLYFDSKSAVLEGLVSRAIAPMADFALSGVANFRGDPRPVIAQVLKTILALMSDEKRLAVPRIVLHEAAAQPEIAQMYRRAVLDRVLPAATALIAQGVEGGHIRKVDPELTVRSVVGPVLMHLLMDEIFGLRPKNGLRLGELVENHLKILDAGLAPETELANV